MEELSDRLGLNKRDRNDWRQQVRQLSEVARANGFSAAVLEDSKERSFQTFAEFLPATVDRPPGEWKRQLDELLQQSIDAIRNGEDGTKKTQSALGVLRELRNELGLRGELFWHQWVKISKIDVGAKSREAVADLREFAASHERHADFQRDIRTFIEQLFDIAMAALDEYDLYKKRRGLIDYTDMEVHINRLLDDPRVQEVLKAELDLLMVDEFQDTSPIQLEIFLKLSRFARYSVWVGDPKQSIYGFRGADPRLMEAIIRQTGIDPKDIQTYSWRSREEIVYATNALFTKAFSKLPPEQVALQPKRRAKAGPDTANRSDEPPEMGRALIHWHFEFDGEGRLPGKPWMENAVAQAVRTLLHRGKLI
ncbi:MAG: UvrD-helicase domain-containing protein, partial [Saprospiraceae bacterium]|nr:UvrD-helicase domain-containing protein [Saprospiraceae bacterium]